MHFICQDCDVFWVISDTWFQKECFLCGKHGKRFSANDEESYVDRNPKSTTLQELLKSDWTKAFIHNWCTYLTSDQHYCLPVELAVEAGYLADDGDHIYVQIACEHYNKWWNELVSCITKGVEADGPEIRRYRNGIAHRHIVASQTSAPVDLYLHPETESGQRVGFTFISPCMRSSGS